MEQLFSPQADARDMTCYEFAPGAPPAAAPWRSRPSCRASDIASQAPARPFVKRSGRSALGFAPPPDRGVSPGPSGVLLRRVLGVRPRPPGQPGQHGETPDHDRRGLPLDPRRLLRLPSHPHRRQSRLAPRTRWGPSRDVEGRHGSAGAAGALGDLGAISGPPSKSELGGHVGPHDAHQSREAPRLRRGAANVGGLGGLSGPPSTNAVRGAPRAPSRWPAGRGRGRWRRRRC